MGWEFEDALKSLRELSQETAAYENTLYQELDFIQRSVILKFGLKIELPEYDPEEWTPKERQPAETNAKPQVACKYGLDIKIPGCKPEQRQPAETTAKPQVARKYGLDIEIPERKPEERKLKERKPEKRKPEVRKPEERKFEERKPEERKPEERKPAETTAKPQSKFLKRKTVDGRLTIVISKDGDISITTTERKELEASKQETAASGASPKVSAEPQPEPEEVPREFDYGQPQLVALLLAKPEEITLAINERQKAKEELKKANVEKTKKKGEDRAEETSKEKANTEKPNMTDQQDKDKEEDPLELLEKSFVDARETLQIVQEQTDAEVKALKSGRKNRSEAEVLRNMNVENVTSVLLQNLREKAKKIAKRDQNKAPYGTEAYYKKVDKKKKKKQQQKAKKQQQQAQDSQAARSANAGGVDELYEAEQHRWDDMLTSEEFHEDAYRRKKAVMELYEKKTCMLHELRLARSLNFNLENTLNMTKMRIGDVEEQVAATRARIHHKPGCICKHH